MLVTSLLLHNISKGRVQVGVKSWYSQAFEKPGQAPATWSLSLSFVSPNPVTVPANQPNLVASIPPHPLSDTQQSATAH